jgi:transcriptional regulator with XRE-family HTH domain
LFDKKSIERMLGAMTFATLIKLLRTSKHLTVFDVSQASGLSTQTIFNIEAGKGCRLSNALRLASALGLNEISTQLMD